MDEHTALHAGAETLTPLQHVAAAVTVLAAELGDHPHLAADMQTRLGATGGPGIYLHMVELHTTRAQRAAMLHDVARVVGGEVEGPGPSGIATVDVLSWQGSGIALHAHATVADRDGGDDE